MESYKTSHLEVHNFSCGYRSKFLIKDITFQVNKSCFTGIIGPNGAGKTTLFKGITNELKKFSGYIKLQGKDISQMSYKEKACSMAVVSQNVESIAVPVEEYVLMGRLPYRSRFQLIDKTEDIAIAEKYMKLTGVDRLRGKYLSELSGGEQQLASIARALTQEPELLLLDEPTSHLDITHAIEVLNLIQRLNEQLGLTVLMIIHDLNLAGEYCDSLVLLNKGKVHSSGTPEEVLNYKNIEEVYQTVVITETNPISQKPVIFPISERVLNQSKSSLK